MKDILAKIAAAKAELEAAKAAIEKNKGNAAFLAVAIGGLHTALENGGHHLEAIAAAEKKSAAPGEAN